MRLNDYGDIDKGEVNGAKVFGLSVKVVLAFMAIAALVVVLGWGFDTGWTFATQKTNMRKEAYVATFNGANKLATDLTFNTLYNDIVAKDKQIAVQRASMKEFAAASPDKGMVYQQAYAQMQGNLSGTQSIVQTEIAEYNSKVNALQTKSFLPANLPTSLDPANPPTVPIQPVP